MRTSSIEGGAAGCGVVLDAMLYATQGTAGQNTVPGNGALGGGGVYSEDNEYTLCYRM